MTWQIPKPDECESPNLWKGCVGLWVPALGPTGLTLWDLSGYQRHGTLTNMVAGTDWVQSPIGPALEIVGASSQYVAASPWTWPVAVPLTLGAWFKISLDGASEAILSVYDFDAESGWFLNAGMASAGDPFRAITAHTGLYGIATAGGISMNVWHCGVGVFRSNASRVAWLDGVAGAEETTSRTPSGAAIEGAYMGRALTNRNMTGQIGPCGVWNRVLQPAEIQDFYRWPPVSCGGMLTRRRRIFAASVAAPPATNRRRRLLLGSCA